jgi:hypothetical protein
MGNEEDALGSGAAGPKDAGVREGRGLLAAHICCTWCRQAVDEPPHPTRCRIKGRSLTSD